MSKRGYVKWCDLFQEEIGNLGKIETLQEIDLGYNSKVHLLSIDGKQYAVKMYDERFNGTAVCQIERQNIEKARLAIPDAVPHVLFCSTHLENAFQREILVMEHIEGVPMNKTVCTKEVFQELVNVLTRLHNTRTSNRKAINEEKRIDICRKTLMTFLKKDEVLSLKRLSKHFDLLHTYSIEKKLFNFQKTIIHGDLWWDNILVDDGKIRIIDWLESSEEDYCRDIAQLRIGTLSEIFDTTTTDYFFKRIVNSYKKKFEDETIWERMRYYVALLYLEEAFYLPFKFFPWELKYRENPANFKKRFIDYFQKSESYFRNER